MAQKVETKFVDDLDGSDAEGTILFGLDGRQYEIDLSEENAATLRDSLADFIAAARKTTSGRTAKMTSRNGDGGRVRADREQTAAIREWARQNGHTVADKGRIPKAVVDAYHAAH